MDGQRRTVVARSKRGGRKLLLLLPMLVLFAGCDLAITKSASPDPATVGEPLTYTLNVTNLPTDPPPSTGDQGVANVTVRDTLPESVEFVSATPTQGTCTPPGTDPTLGDTVACNIGTLEVNQSATIEIVVIPNAAGQIENTANVDGFFRTTSRDPNVQGPFCDDLGPGNCDPQGNNTVTITTLVNEPVATPPPDEGGEEPTPPDDQYGEDPTPPGDQYGEDPTPPGQTPVPPGDDVIGRVGDAFPAGNLCQNIASGIDTASSNNASQSAGSDAATQTADGNGNTQIISQDEAQAIAQENNTTIGVVQQCAQDSGVNVIGGDGTGTVTSPGTDTTGSSGSVDGGISGNAASAVDTLDSNGDSVIGEAEARSVLGADAPEAMDEADTDANGTVSVAEAETFASEPASAQADVSTGSSASTGIGASSETIGVLPDTGGASLFTLAGGVLLVAGGLVARRIVR